MSGLGGKVAIIGTGTIKFGENFHQSLTSRAFRLLPHHRRRRGRHPDAG